MQLKHCLCLLLLVALVIGCDDITTNSELDQKRAEVPTSSVEISKPRAQAEIDTALNRVKVETIVKEIERARKPGSEDYDIYLSWVKEKQKKPLDAAKKELRLVLNDPGLDPADALAKTRDPYWFTLRDLSITGAEMRSLEAGAKQLGLKKVQNLQKKRERSANYTRFLIMSRYGLSRTEAGLSAKEAHRFYVDTVFDRMLDLAPKNTGYVIETGALPKAVIESRPLIQMLVRSKISDLDLRSASAEKPSWPGRKEDIVSIARNIWHWNYTAEELGISPAQYSRIMQQARVIAKNKASQLLSQLRDKNDKSDPLKAYELRELLSLVRPEEIQTTTREAAHLIVDERSKYIEELK